MARKEVKNRLSVENKGPSVSPPVIAGPHPDAVREYEEWLGRSAAKFHTALAPLLVQSAFGADPQVIPLATRLLVDHDEERHARIASAAAPDTADFPCDLKPGEQLGVAVLFHPYRTPVLGFADERLPVSASALDTFAEERVIRWKALQKLRRGTGFVLLRDPFFQLPPNLHESDGVRLLISAPPEVLAKLGFAGRSTFHGSARTVEVPWNAYSTVVTHLRTDFASRGGELFLAVVRLPGSWQSRRVKQQRTENRESLRRCIDERIGELADVRLSDVFVGLPEFRREIAQELKSHLEERLRRAAYLLEAAPPAERRQFTLSLRDELNALELRVQCPKCSEPATLRFAPIGNAREGAFFFEHAMKVYHAVSTTPPPLTLVPKPPDKRRKT
ncbi:MAG: hypothetical protein AMXMBFR47_23200 [Planctomycetota bacterium]